MKEFIESFRDEFTLGELQWLQQTYDFKLSAHSNRIKQSNEISETKIKKSKDSILKWRSAEMKCIEFEKMQGNKAEDVSKKNLGYDIHSVTPYNKNRYIEVKSVKQRGARFSMTNNEYTAAHIYQDEYFICVVYESNNQVIFEYIQNPLKKINLEKVVRQWEWICEDYGGESFEFNLI